MKEPPKARPDKQKIVDEVWDEDRIKSFLHTSTPTQSGKPFPGDHDFYVLLRAYRSMRVHDFERFLDLFQDGGGEVEARNGDGQTICEFISTHEKAGPYREALRNSAAKANA